MANFTGTASNDVITPKEVSAGVTRDPSNAKPSAASDYANGGVGNDTIALSGGNDYLNGDVGNDSLDGGSENDDLRGGDGNDTLIGGSGNDYLQGGEGSDVYQFGKNWGQDTVSSVALTGRDVIEFLNGVAPEKLSYRVEGDDLIISQGANSIYVTDQFAANGTPAVREVDFADGSTLNVTKVDPDWLVRKGTNLAETIYGSIFKDRIDARDGNDQVYGNDGNDVIIGGKGNDYLVGGLGNDVYQFAKGFGLDTLSEASNGGKDVIEFLAGIDRDDLDISVQGSSLIIQRGADQITLQSQYYAGQGSSALFESLRFDQGADLDIRKVDADWITRVGRNTAERFDGSIFKDTIDGGGGNDTISGVDGNDSLTGGRGDDYLYGGAGNDLYRFSNGDGVDSISESFNGGKDVIAFDGVSASSLHFRIDGTSLLVTYGKSSISIGGQFSSGVGSNALVEKMTFDDGSSINLTKPQAEWLTLKGGNLGETFNGSVFGDTIDGGGGNDYLSGGGAGRDSLSGGVGDDTIYGGVDNDTLLGAKGMDAIAGGDGNDSIDGGDDNDNLRGEIGNDIILGGKGADTIDGGDGRNRIDGGAGADSLIGGVDKDTFVFHQNDGNDVITNFSRKDVLEFDDFGAKYDTPEELLAAVKQDGDDAVIDLIVNGVRSVHLVMLGVDVDKLTADNFSVA